MSTLDLQVVARRIGEQRRLRAQGLADLGLAANGLIEQHPTCPRRVSQLVDKLLLLGDLARLEVRP